MEKRSNFMDKNRYIHFIGIGGTGMSGIAQILLELNYKISGSDIKSNANTRRLEKKGARIFTGHRAENFDNLDIGAVVVSTAINGSNPELERAKADNIAVYRRAEVLGYILNNKFGVAVAGTHGKTTTTSLISMLMENHELNPTVIVGGEVCDFGSNAKLGGGTYTVVEADESDSSFLYLTPRVIVTTNIEEDHLDFYSGIDQIKTAFINFFNKLKDDGYIIYCSDSVNINALRSKMPERAKILTYGIDPVSNPDFKLLDIRQNGMGVSFELKFREKSFGRFKLNIPGLHNALNATAAIIVCTQTLGLSVESLRNNLLKFKGVERRFQVVGEVEGITVVDDYAHHPTEINAVLNTARSSFDKRIIAIFQPHRFSRTRHFYEEMAGALNTADVVILTDIYQASEAPISGVSSELILNTLQRMGKKDSLIINDIKNVAGYTASIARKNDFIFTIGAGDVTTISPDIVKKLQEKYLNKKAFTI